MKVAVVGVVGRTNAGKSSLVNQLVREKVSIVSPCEQTTRNTIRGIVEEERGQLVLLDTPGLHKAVGTLGKLLNRMARRSVAGTDILCLVFDASEAPQLEDVGWMERIVHDGQNQEAGDVPRKLVFVLNKADRAPFYETMYREAWQTACGSAIDISPIWVKSIATTEGGANAVLDALFDLAEAGERLFDPDIVTDYPRKLTIADVIREQYIARLFQELPHELGIVVRQIRENTGRWDVDVEVLVNRESQKPMAIGKGAAIIKAVRKAAERELKEIFGLKVELAMTVRVERNWMKNERLLMEMGYLGELV